LQATTDEPEKVKFYFRLKQSQRHKKDFTAEGAETNIYPKIRFLISHGHTWTKSKMFSEVHFHA